MADNGFEAFWTEYLRAHTSKLNRTLHAVGISLAIVCVVAAIKKRKPWLLLGAPLFGYGFAWCGHFFVEKNAPATFSHPIYSLRAAARLYRKTLDGSIEAELESIRGATEADAPPETAKSAAAEATTAVN